MMQLHVDIACVRCGQVITVHVMGGWDLHGVDHVCRDIAGLPDGDGGIHVHFKPPRRPF